MLVMCAALAVLALGLACAHPAPALAAKTGIVTQHGQIHYKQKNGKLAKSKFKRVGSKLYYFDAKGNAVRSGKVKGIAFTKSGVAKANTASKLKIALMKRVGKYKGTRAQKLRACWGYVLSRPFVNSTEPKDIGKPGWVQRAALRCLNSGVNECIGCASTFAMCAYELGYSPKVMAHPYIHGYVVINGKRWDNMASQPSFAHGTWKVVDYATVTPKYWGTYKKAAEKKAKQKLAKKAGLRWSKGSLHLYEVRGTKLAKVKSAWRTVKGKRYWFKKNGKAATGPCKVKGTWYVFGAKGALKRGTKTRVVKVAGVKYRVKASGKAKAGWNAAKTSYYLKTGELACGVRVVGSKLFAASARGVYDAALTKSLRAAAVAGGDPTTLLGLLGTPVSHKMAASCYHLDGVTEGGIDHAYTYAHIVVNVYEAPDTGLLYLESFVAR